MKVSPPSDPRNSQQLFRAKKRNTTLHQAKIDRNEGCKITAKEIIPYNNHINSNCVIIGFISYDYGSLNIVVPLKRFTFY